MAESLRESLATFFPSDLGFGNIVQLDYTDGVRVSFSTGDVVHIRPSGNADELRIYAVADTQGGGRRDRKTRGRGTGRHSPAYGKDRFALVGNAGLRPGTDAAGVRPVSR